MFGSCFRILPVILVSDARARARACVCVCVSNLTKKNTVLRVVLVYKLHQVTL